MIFDYFFLKFYNRSLKSSLKEQPRHLASLLFGLFINFNIVEISMVLAKLDILPFIYPFDDKTIAYMSTPVLAVIVFFIYKKSRIEEIKIKFSKEEFKHMKRKLNIVFTLYIVFTILALFIILFWKANYLPTW